MNISKEVTKLEKSRAKLSLTIGKDDVRSEYDELITNYSKSIQLPGFRKGKVPRDVLVRKYGDALKEEALGKIIEKAVGLILDDESFPRESRPLPYARPEVQDEPKLDLDTDLQFSLVYDVLPEVKIEKWQGLTVEIPDVSIGDEDINKELEAIRERNSVVLDKADGEAAANGDVVTINYCECDDSGSALPGSERQDFTFTLGSGHNIYQFDDELAGMKKDETKEFTKSFAADNKDFPGETKKLKVTLTALKLKKLPELDDDLAQDVDEKYKTLDDLKNNIRQRLEKDLENVLRSTKLNKLLEQIRESSPVEIPESMLSMELDSRWKNLAQRLNTDPNGLYKMMGNSPEKAEAIIESWKEDATKSLHTRLILETLIEDQKLEASEEDLALEREKMAAESGASLEDIKQYFEQVKVYIEENIKEQKLLDILLEKNTIKTGKKERYIDLVSNIR